MPKRSIWIWLIASAYAVTAVSQCVSWIPLVVSGEIWAVHESDNRRPPILSLAIVGSESLAILLLIVVAGFGFRVIQIYALFSYKYRLGMLICFILMGINIFEHSFLIWSILDAGQSCKENCDDLGFGLMIIAFNMTYILISVAFAVAVVIYLRRTIKNMMPNPIPVTDG